MHYDNDAHVEGKISSINEHGFHMDVLALRTLRYNICLLIGKIWFKMLSSMCAKSFNFTTSIISFLS